MQNVSRRTGQKNVNDHRISKPVCLPAKDDGAGCFHGGHPRREPCLPGPPSAIPELMRLGPVSGLASDALTASRPSPSRVLRSGSLMALDSLTVAGAAPALRDGLMIPRTGFPFNPYATKAAGHPKGSKERHFKVKWAMRQPAPPLNHHLRFYVASLRETFFCLSRNAACHLLG